MRTRDGMKVGEAKGRLRGKQPKLKRNQARHWLGSCTTSASTPTPNWPNFSASEGPQSTEFCGACDLPRPERLFDT
jgi:hypothetical protein